MQLTDLCTSLETSKKLQELGFNYSHVFCRYEIGNKWEILQYDTIVGIGSKQFSVPCRTASELMEALPDSLAID